MSDEQLIEQLNLFERTGLWLRAEFGRLQKKWFLSKRDIRRIKELTRRNELNHTALIRFMRTHKIL